MPKNCLIFYYSRAREAKELGRMLFGKKNPRWSKSCFLGKASSELAASRAVIFGSRLSSAVERGSEMSGSAEHERSADDDFPLPSGDTLMFQKMKQWNGTFLPETNCVNGYVRFDHGQMPGRDRFISYFHSSDR